jgi:hypothetical protein
LVWDESATFHEQPNTRSTKTRNNGFTLLFVQQNELKEIRENLANEQCAKSWIKILGEQVYKK